MERVTGIGGIFFKASDPTALVAWYKAHLGIDASGGFCSFPWRDANDPERLAGTVWAPFPSDTTYFKPSDAAYMINYRVADLDRMVAQLQAGGVAIAGRTDDTNGRFAWVMDPDGNRVELWEPPAGA